MLSGLGAGTASRRAAAPVSLLPRSPVGVDYVEIKYILPLDSGCLAHRPRNSTFSITGIFQGDISRVPV